MFLPCNLEPKNLKRWQTLAAQCQRQLTEQQILPGNPGTILKDVNTFLECIGPDGMVTRSRNACVPSERLPELNAKSGHPIELPLKRPLLRDYPNLAGVFILLRVMELVEMQGNRLTVQPAALEVWRGLNFTEQYFALLEALLFQAQSSVLGARVNRREETQTFQNSIFFLGHLSNHWCQFDEYASIYILGPQGQLPPWHLFALQQFGLIELRPRERQTRERKPSGGQGWLAGAAKLTPWGIAVTWALLEHLKKAEAAEEAAYASAHPEADESKFKGMEWLLFDEDPGAKPERTARPASAAAKTGAEAAAAESTPAPEFGALRPEFHPYFPEWQNLYARPRREARPGAHIFKVKLAGWQGGGGGIWRRLAAPPEASLDQLAGAIISAFNFDDDHLYDFRYRDQRGRQRSYNHPGTDEGPFTTEITVGETEAAANDPMLFTYDYGDNWQFEVRLEQIETKPCRQKKVTVVASAGKAPAQYASWD